MNVSSKSSLPILVESSEDSSNAHVAEDAGATSEDPGSHPASSRDLAWKPAFWMICGAASFTLMGGMANILGTRCDWRIVAQFRTIFSFMAAATLTALAGARFVVFRPRILWVRSIAGTLSLITTFFALTHLPVADVLTLTNTYPIWIVTIGFLAWGESVEGSILAAIVSAVIGVALIQQPHLEGNRVALFSALSAAFFTSVAMMGLNRLGQVDPRAVVAHFSAVASIAMIPLLFLGHPADFTVLEDSRTLALLFGVGISGTIGQIFLTKAFAAGSAPRIAVIGMSQVAMALVFDVIYRERMPPLVSLAGMTLVVAPVIWLILTGRGNVKGRRSPASKSSTFSIVSRGGSTILSRARPVASYPVFKSPLEGTENGSIPGSAHSPGIHERT